MGSRRPLRPQGPGLRQQPHGLLLLCLQGSTTQAKGGSSSLALAPGRREEKADEPGFPWAGATGCSGLDLRALRPW